jgi:hypothetical protein
MGGSTGGQPFRRVSAAFLIDRMIREIITGRYLREDVCKF